MEENTMEQTSKSFKGFDKDVKCRGFQFEIGKEYEEPDAKACDRGFHACEFPIDEYIVVTKDENGVERFFLNANGDLTPIGSREIFEEWKRLLESYIPRFKELFLSFNEELEKAIEKHNK